MSDATETARGFIDRAYEPSKVTPMPGMDTPLPPEKMNPAQRLDHYFSKVKFDNGARPLVAPKWLVRDTVSDGGLVFIGGQSTAGKSFVVMELARCLMTGDDFFGRVVDRQCGVVLFAPEGQETIDARLAAMKRHYNITEDLPFAYLGDLPSFETPEGRQLVVEILKKVDQVFQERFDLPLGAAFMDTLAATFQLKDQNDSSEAALRIAQLKEIRDGVGNGITLLPVHHYGKTVEAGLTGGHGWKAGADQVLSVLAEKNETTGDCSGRELALAKNRNGPEGPIAPFELRYEGLGYREDGTEWGSLYLVPLVGQPSTIANRGSRAPKMAKHLRTFEESVNEALINHAQAFQVGGGTGPNVQAVPIVPFVREVFFSKYPTGADDPLKSPEANDSARYEAKRKAFQRAVSQMGPKFGTETTGGREWIWKL